MKLAAKLILIFVLGIFAIVALFSWQTILRQRAWSHKMHAESAADLVDALKPSIEEAYREGGVVRIQEMIEVTQRSINSPKLRWLEDGNQGSEPQSSSSQPNTQIQSRRTSTVSISNGDQQAMYYTTVPLDIDGINSGKVEVAKPSDESNVHESLTDSILSLLGVASLSAIVIYWGGLQLVGKPLQKLIRQVHSIGDGELDQPPAITTRDEFGQLALAISEMSSRLSQQRDTIRAETESRIRSERQLRHADRLSTIGTLSAGVAHELGTPLNVIAGRAGLIEGGRLTAEEVAASARTIKSEADRMTKIVRQLLDFARSSSNQLQSVQPSELVQQTCQLLEPLAKKAKVHLEFIDAPEPRPWVHGDPSQLKQVFTNLVTNAIAAMPDGGTVTLSIAVNEHCVLEGTPDKGAGGVVISVKDTGVGIPKSDASRVFEPFFTTKDVGDGTGLGLSIAYGIVREHGGCITVESEPQKGATFHVMLPLTERSSERATLNADKK